MSKPETLADLLTIGDISKGDLKKVAAALWRQNAVATRALTAPYRVSLPDFYDLSDHVQGFIIKGLLEAAIEPTFELKDNACGYRENIHDC